MSATDAKDRRPARKRPYRAPRVRSERVTPPDMFASGADGFKEPDPDNPNPPRP